MHDWGGMIGFGWALSHLPQVQRLVILNTAAFPLPTAKPMPWRLSLGRDSRVGGFLIRAFNLFARGAAWLGTERRLPAAVRRAYITPYNGWRNAISTLRFMQDIPLRAAIRPGLVRSGTTIAGVRRQTHYRMGVRDSCSTATSSTVPSRLPDAKCCVRRRHHYVLEDRHEIWCQRSAGSSRASGVRSAARVAADDSYRG